MKNNEFGELLHNLRTNKNLTYTQVADEIQDKRIDEKVIKKWERGLDYPKIEHMYKLSEIYNIEPEKLLESKQKTMQINCDTIHYKFIDRLSATLNISTKTLIWTSRILIGATLILVFLWFLGVASRVVN